MSIIVELDTLQTELELLIRAVAHPDYVPRLLAFHLKDFSNDDHQAIYKALAAVYKDDSHKSADAIIYRLREMGKLNAAELVISKLHSDAGTTPPEPHEAHLRKVIRKRAFALAAEKIQKIAAGPYINIEAMAEVMELELESYHRSVTLPVVSAASGLLDPTAPLEELHQPHGFIPCGIPEIDSHLGGGFERSSLITLGGDTGVGKSTLLLNCAWNIASREKAGKVLFFSFEMPVKSNQKRLLSMGSRVEHILINNGAFKKDPAMRKRLQEARERMWTGGLANIEFVDFSVNDLRGVLALIHKYAQAGNLDCVMIDYLQRMVIPTAERMDLAVGSGTTRLKTAALKLDVPIVIASQFNRKIADGEIPDLVHLKESSSIGQDSDVVLLMYRDRNPGTLLVRVRKVRNGRETDRDAPLRIPYNRAVFKIGKEKEIPF